MVSGTTLSGQSENIRGVGVVRRTEGTMLREGCLWKTSKWSAAAKACVHVVPPFELISLAKLPAKQYDSAISKGWEIDEAAIEILQLNTQNVQLRHFFSQVSENLGVLHAVGHSAAALFCSFGSQLCVMAVCGQATAVAPNFLQ